MSIKEEFLKEFSGRLSDAEFIAAGLGAKWMAEHIASRMASTTQLAMEIRQLAKELQ